MQKNEFIPTVWFFTTSSVCLHVVLVYAAIIRHTNGVTVCGN